MQPGPTEPQMAAVESLKALTRDDAIRRVKEQNDIAVGKEQRTIALIRDVTTWYEVDSSHPDAVAKARQLRDFYAAFHDEYAKLHLTYGANKSFFNGEDIFLLEESMSGAEEIESKMRRLKAMGFK